MSLATVDCDGLPDVRMVLLKGVDENGFVFYTNGNSIKAGQVKDQPKAALGFHWKSLRRQVRIRGAVERVSDAQADAYFASRSRKSQIGAWCSDQSDILDSRSTLEARLKKAEDKFAGKDVPRPAHWYGWRIIPSQIEFWMDMPFRLHDRLVFKRDNEANEWTKLRLYP